MNSKKLQRDSSIVIATVLLTGIFVAMISLSLFTVQQVVASHANSDERLTYPLSDGYYGADYDSYDYGYGKSHYGYFYGNYDEEEYSSYEKQKSERNDHPKANVQILSCNNINKQKVSVNLDLDDASALANVEGVQSNSDTGTSGTKYVPTDGETDRSDRGHTNTESGIVNICINHSTPQISLVTTNNVDRSTEISQVIDQSQNACSNEGTNSQNSSQSVSNTAGETGEGGTVEIVNDLDSTQTGSISQSNDCTVTQTQTASNSATATNN